MVDNVSAVPVDAVENTTDGQLINTELERFPLQNAWSFHFLRNDHSRFWADNLVFIATVRTVDEFWSVVNHMQSVGKMQSNSDYMLFKEGIKPMWEDPNNRSGGRWILTVDKRQRSIDIDACWLHLMLSLIGDQFLEDDDFITGAVVSVRKSNDKLSLWTKYKDREDVQRRIGRKFKEFLCLPSSVTICFEPHSIEEGAGDKRKEVEYLYKE